MINLYDGYDERDYSLITDWVEDCGEYDLDAVVLAYDPRYDLQEAQELCREMDRIHLNYKVFETEVSEGGIHLVIHFINDLPTLDILPEDLRAWIQEQDGEEPLLMGVPINRLSEMYTKYREQEQSIYEKEERYIPSRYEAPDEYYQADDGDYVYFGDYLEPEEEEARWKKERERQLHNDKAKKIMQEISEEYESICRTSEMLQNRIRKVQEDRVKGQISYIEWEISDLQKILSEQKDELQRSILQDQIHSLERDIEELKHPTVKKPETEEKPPEKKLSLEEMKAIAQKMAEENDFELPF